MLIFFYRRKVESDGDSNPIIHDIEESETIQVDQDNVYAVFVTYVEIYNNSVYDLLEDEDIRTKYNNIYSFLILLYLISNNIIMLKDNF